MSGTMTGASGHRSSGVAGAPLGHPRIHLRRTDSTNERARQLALAGAPHGTTVTADEQSAGRGRQGRSWLAPPRSALLCSLVLRDPPPLLSLIAGVAVCDAVGERARVKWPNDVVIERAGTDAHPLTAASVVRSTNGQTPGAGDREQPTLAKLAGILVEGRPQEGWAILGIGLNVAVRVEQLPLALRGRAASLELDSGAIEPTLKRLIERLIARLAVPVDVTLDAWRARDALYDRHICWDSEGRRGKGGRAQGIDAQGRLLVRGEDGIVTALSAGEVHLESVG
jgi:BirA family transcriptional regulator, biotin operon repressor / biotin---[acetyl-CoA-carboxylase] ligase